MLIYIASTAFALTTVLALTACQTVDLLPTSEVTTDPSQDTTPATGTHANPCEDGECNDDNLLDSDGCFECMWTCDANPECEGPETPENCPSQCGSIGSVCGDGKITGEETCECGGDGEPCAEKMYWPDKPPEGTCYNCMIAQWCGDGQVNGGEICDTKGPSATCDSDCTEIQCGDGEYNAAGEECEVGHSDCQSCRFVRLRVFVTSLLFCGNMGTYTGTCSNNPEEKSGVARGDALCQQLANSAVPRIKGTMKAWLSDGTNGQLSPVSRFSAATKEFAGRYVMVKNDEDEVFVAQGWNGLISGSLKNPINVDEAGTTISKNLQVWTNTDADGASSGDGDCKNWADKSNDSKGGHGLANSNVMSWTANGPRGCNTGARLYCFEDPAP